MRRKMWCLGSWTRAKRLSWNLVCHDDVIKLKHFPRSWPCVRGMVNSLYKGQWRGALVFYLICTWKNGWVNNGEAGDLRRHRIHQDVIAMWRNRQTPVATMGKLYLQTPIIKEVRRLIDTHWRPCDVSVMQMILTTIERALFMPIRIHFQR